MKRIHLFEFEDLNWFPNIIRKCMTRYIIVMHKLLDSKKDLVKLVDKALNHTSKKQILDLCSGSGGPMPDVHNLLKEKHPEQDLKLVLSDLYPNLEAANKINSQNSSNISYLTTPVDASNISKDQEGIRTMICSMHHMKEDVAHNILKDAKEKHQPICIFEISDNSFPKWLWWIAIPTSFIMSLFVTPFVKPLSWQQLLFTYLIPVIPICIAWDGAVSNARTYTLEDLDILLDGLISENYKWEKGTIKGKGGNRLYLLGLPQNN